MGSLPSPVESRARHEKSIAVCEPRTVTGKEGEDLKGRRWARAGRHVSTRESMGTSSRNTSRKHRQQSASISLLVHIHIGRCRTHLQEDGCEMWDRLVPHQRWRRAI